MSQLSFSSFDAMLLVRDAQGRYGNPEEDFPNLVKYADPVARVSR